MIIKVRKKLTHEQKQKQLRRINGKGVRKFAYFPVQLTSSGRYVWFEHYYYFPGITQLTMDTAVNSYSYKKGDLYHDKSKDLYCLTL